MLVPAVAFSDFIAGVHVLAVVAGFGVTFAYPLLFAAAGRMDPGVMPWLLRARQRIGRHVVNPGLLVVVLAGIYLATDEHHWNAFFVQWGIGAVIVIGAIEGSVIIPRAGRLAVVAERDLAASAATAATAATAVAAVAVGGQRTTAAWSPEYLTTLRSISLAGTAMQLILVVTVFLMATHAGA